MFMMRLIFEPNNAYSIVQDQGMAFDISQPTKPVSIDNEELQCQLLSSFNENQKLSLVAYSESSPTESGSEKAPVKNVKQSRKRLIRINKWKKNVRKDLTQKGLEHISAASGKIIPAKSLSFDSLCTSYSLKCRDNFSNNDIKIIHEHFYSLNSQDKLVFLLNFTERIKSGQTKTKKHFFSFRYYLGKHDTLKIRVCKVFFFKTLCINQKPVYNVHFNKNPIYLTPPNEKRRVKTKSRISDSDRIYAIQHIGKFPTTASHYCRADSNKQYLESNLNVSKMYKMNITQRLSDNQTPVSVETFIITDWSDCYVPANCIISTDSRAHLVGLNSVFRCNRCVIRIWINLILDLYVLFDTNMEQFGFGPTAPKRNKKVESFRFVPPLDSFQRNDSFMNDPPLVRTPYTPTLLPSCLIGGFACVDVLDIFTHCSSSVAITDGPVLLLCGIAIGFTTDNLFVCTIVLHRYRLYVFLSVFIHNRVQLSFLHPQKRFIIQYIKKQYNTLTEEKQITFDNHFTKKQNMRIEREKDRNNKINTTAVICFDLENVLPLPKTNVESAFYKRKLNMYNMTVHLQIMPHSQVYCALWHEGIVGRSGNDMASAVLKVFETIFEQNPNITNIITWSDSCVSHNRNSIMTSAMLSFLMKNPTIESINMKFSTPGHSGVQVVDNILHIVNQSFGTSKPYKYLSVSQLMFTQHSLSNIKYKTCHGQLEYIEKCICDSTDTLLILINPKVAGIIKQLQFDLILYFIKFIFLREIDLCIFFLSVKQRY
ncbi:Uncharacterized protein FWK35_00015462, partial [Aphis craccivora]